jgi:hypothetical protein
LGGKKKMPDDMDLFRRKVGDVRRLKVKNRVPPQPPRAAKKPEEKLIQTPISEERDALHKALCPRTPDKNMYDTFQDAARAANHVKQEWGKAVRPYECDTCGKYHLTSK